MAVKTAPREDPRTSERNTVLEPEVNTVFGRTPLSVEDVVEARSRESQRKLLTEKIEEALRDQAEALGVNPEIWRRLPEEDRKDILLKGIPQGTIAEDAADAARIEFGDLSDLQRVFAGKSRGMIGTDDKKNWTVVCDPVKYDPRWGRYTPGVSRMAMAVAVRKTDPKLFDPPFTLEPVAPFAPDPDIACRMHTADGGICTYATYEDIDKPGVSTLLMDHQQLIHPREYKAREAQQTQSRYEEEREEARMDREERKALLATLAELQAQNRALLAQLTGKKE